MYTLKYTKQTQKDAEKIKEHGLKPKVQNILEQITIDPFVPPYKKLIGDLSGCYSRRINIQHRLIYEVFNDIKVVRVLRMWSHYSEN